MTKIIVLDRVRKKKIQEEVYGESFIKAFYGTGKIAEFLHRYGLPILACYPLFSKLYGCMQKSLLSKGKVKPFIEKYGVNEGEFLLPVEAFHSFNDFFIRKLKPQARPVVPGGEIAILPADGRYLVYQNVEAADGFVVKGKKFSLKELLQDEVLAKKYEKGAMVIARLCPTDYHRFHFPFSCTPSEPKKIKGPLYSVNPLALRKRIEILAENKREITTLETGQFGKVLFIEVGATCVGAIHQTYIPGEPYAKGEEKGYFSFGGSSLVILFEPDKIQFDQDLVHASEEKLEVLGLMGQSLGKAL